MPTARVLCLSARSALEFCDFGCQWYHPPTMTIDTLEYVKMLEAAGVDRKVAEAHAEAFRAAAEDELPTKTDFEKVRARIDLLTWMVGFNLAATMAVLWKLLR